MPKTNMDVRNHEDAESPVFEFTLPTSELEAAFTMGEKGEVIIPCEVIAVNDDSVTLRKIDAARTDKHFQQETAMDMKKRIGVVKNTEGSDKE